MSVQEYDYNSKYKCIKQYFKEIHGVKMLQSTEVRDLI